MSIDPKHEIPSFIREIIEILYEFQNYPQECEP